MVKLNKAQRREASDVIEAVSSGNVELETYAFELVGLRARVAELEAAAKAVADAARAYMGNPVNANDLPQSWQLLDDLTQAALRGENAP